MTANLRASWTFPLRFNPILRGLRVLVPGRTGIKSAARPTDVVLPSANR